MIEVETWADEATRTPNNVCYWVAETVLDDGRRFTARSRHGARNELARQLVEAGVADDEMQTYATLGGRRMKTLHYRSFHGAAKWTFSEGDGPLHRARYVSPENIAAGFAGKGQKGGISVPGDVEPAGTETTPEIATASTPAPAPSRVKIQRPA